MMACYYMHTHISLAQKKEEGETKENIRREEKHNPEKKKTRKNTYFNKREERKDRPTLLHRMT
jgi:hypothetical protein